LIFLRNISFSSLNILESNNCQFHFFEKIPKSNNHWFWLLFQKLQKTNDFHQRIYAKKLNELWKVP
jgi:hypothetical protein